jgi:hypothetical protein
LLRDADLGLMVVGAAQFRRAVKFVADYSLGSVPGAQFRVPKALEAFDATTSAKVVCDLDQHFDAYLIGTGMLQTAGGGLGDYCVVGVSRASVNRGLTQPRSDATS